MSNERGTRAQRLVKAAKTSATDVLRALADDVPGVPEPTTEYAIEMSSGAMQVRCTDPEVERVYPLDEWIKNHTRNGGKVYQRRVVVVDDWVEVR